MIPETPEAEIVTPLVPKAEKTVLEEALEKAKDNPERVDLIASDVYQKCSASLITVENLAGLAEVEQEVGRVEIYPGIYKVRGATQRNDILEEMREQDPTAQIEEYIKTSDDVFTRVNEALMNGNVSDEQAEDFLKRALDAQIERNPSYVYSAAFKQLSEDDPKYLLEWNKYAKKELLKAKDEMYEYASQMVPRFNILFAGIREEPMFELDKRITMLNPHEYQQYARKLMGDKEGDMYQKRSGGFSDRHNGATVKLFYSLDLDDNGSPIIKMNKKTNENSTVHEMVHQSSLIPDGENPDVIWAGQNSSGFTQYSFSATADVPHRALDEAGTVVITELIQNEKLTPEEALQYLESTELIDIPYEAPSVRLVELIKRIHTIVPLLRNYHSNYLSGFERDVKRILGEIDGDQKIYNFMKHEYEIRNFAD